MSVGNGSGVAGSAVTPHGVDHAIPNVSRNSGQQFLQRIRRVVLSRTSDASRSALPSDKAGAENTSPKNNPEHE
jgi:hypothetical protein